MANISKLFDMLEIDEDPDAQTVNGWTMTVLGKIPEENDTFEASGLEVRVLNMDGKRVEKVYVKDVRSSDEDGDTEDERKDED